MTLKSVRNALLNQKTNEITRHAELHRNRLEVLYFVTSLVGGPLAQDQTTFLDSNDISKGLRFRDETLPFPVLKPASFHSTSELQTPKPVLNAPSPLSPASDFVSKSSASELAKIPATASSKQVKAPSTLPVTHTPPRSPNTPPRLEKESNEPQPKGSTRIALVPTVSPKDKSPATSLGTITKASQVHPSTPTKGLGLVDDGVKKDSAQSAARDKDEDADHTQGEVASSPSSTAGAYSNSTPKPLPHSPDTSPEAPPSPFPHPDLADARSTSLPLQVETPISNRTTTKKGPVDTVGVDSTPDAQLRLEEAQANEAAAKPAHPLVNGDHVPITDGIDALGDATNGDVVPTLSSAESSMQSSHDDVDMIDASPSKLDSITMPAPKIIPETPGRMRTRVASGAIRQRSVSEILGELPKPSPSIVQTPTERKEQKLLTLDDRRDGTRKSTVVFSKDKDVMSHAVRSEMDGYLALRGASLDPDKDYLRPLFLYQAFTPPRGSTLSDLIHHNRKAVTTSDMTSNLREQIDHRILRRIYQLQNANKWSLRQPLKYPDPAPVHTHWDSMIDEMKWMRTDFKEERKWKLAIARNLARWCSDYVNAPEQDKSSLRVKAITPPNSRIIADSFDEPPELMSGGTSEASEDEQPLAYATQSPPHTLFSLDFDDVIFKMNKTPSAHALIGELPLYDPTAESQPVDSAIPVPPKDNILPVSKFVTGKIVPKMAGVPKKRSRYDYEPSDDDNSTPSKRARSDSSAPFLSPARRSSPRTEIPPEDQDVALFNPVNKHILQRIRQTNAFRPPSEFPMPSQGFYENRYQSKWTWEEDQRLRHCVRQYHYNWSMIAMELQSKCQPSKFISGQDRRTPWECFERWTQLEGLPADLNRSLYFRAYSQRIEASIRAVQEKQQAAGAQNATSGRIRGLPPDKIGQKRDSRHVAMIDVMRRLARRRENNIHRQQEALKTAAMRKVHADNNANVPRFKFLTPAEWSREKSKAEYSRNLQLQTEQDVKRQALLRQGPQTPAAVQQQAAIAAAVAQRKNSLAAAAGNATQQPSTSPALSQNRPQMQGMQTPTANGVGMAGLTQAQQLQALQNLQQASQLNPQATNNATAQQQLAALQQRQLQQQMRQLPSQTANLVAAHLSPGGGMPNAHQQQMLAAMQRANFANSMNGMASSSPTSAATNNNSMNQQLLNIMTVLQQQYPTATMDQLRAAATERLRRSLQAAALAQASGTGMAMTNPQQVALAQQQLAMQQQHNMNAFAHPTSQLGINGGLGPMASPAQGLAAVLSQQQTQQSPSPSNAAAVLANNSPTQMYRPMSAQAQAGLAQQHQNRLGSPAMAPVRPDSRGSVGTPLMRSVSATGSSINGHTGVQGQSPILGSGGMGR